MSHGCHNAFIYQLWVLTWKSHVKTCIGSKMLLKLTISNHSCHQFLIQCFLCFIHKPWYKNSLYFCKSSIGRKTNVTRSYNNHWLLLYLFQQDHRNIHSEWEWQRQLEQGLISSSEQKPWLLSSPQFLSPSGVHPFAVLLVVPTVTGVGFLEREEGLGRGSLLIVKIIHDRCR